MCIVEWVPRQDEKGVSCSHVRGALRGRVWTEFYCESPPRRHHFVLAQALPNGTHATVHRVARPAIRVKVRRNMLLVDLRVRTVADVPKFVRWRHGGRLHRTRLPVYDSQASCH